MRLSGGASIGRILLLTLTAADCWDDVVYTDEALRPAPRTAVECLAKIAAPGHHR